MSRDPNAYERRRERLASEALDTVCFWCRACKHRWEAPPEEVAEDPERPHHPFRYLSTCPKCEAQSEQAPHERALIAAWCRVHGIKPGPRTPEGIAASAKNLEGHPTPEEALRTRFNGMKHGLNARTATYFPSKPDRYAFCKACEVDRDWCRAQPACAKQTELFMLHHAAFEQKNPAHLQGIYADFHAALMATIQQILQAIIADGVTIKQPRLIGTPAGALVAEYVDEHGQRQFLWDIEAHPLFKPLAELMTRTGISLTDLGMTPKQIEDDGEELGRLETEQRNREEASAFQERQVAALESLAGLIQRARGNAARDPVLIEYQRQNGSDDGAGLGG